MTAAGATPEAPPIRDLGLSAWLPVAGKLLPMDAYGSVLEHLSRDECMRLMGSVPVGRIVYTRQALPAVELVNFAMDDGDIIIRTDSGGKLAAATRGAVVAFEADSVDTTAHTGWSVTIVGYSHAVTDDDEVRHLEQVGLVPWAPGERDHFIRISPTFVNGRRIAAGRLAGDGDARSI
jgi:nitroimidazol reductase NimA-like FMN-containing flavoprotein (pyridoxamine 5'-phosphate oxidase superfamily)